jgi:hypothetical protein
MSATEPTQPTKQCPFCAKTINADALQCNFCGQWLKIPAQPTPGQGPPGPYQQPGPYPPQQPGPYPPQQPVPYQQAGPYGGFQQGMPGVYATSVYDPFFDLNQIPPEQREQFKRNSFFGTFPVAVVVLLHIITLGFFSLIYMGLKHGKLPRIKQDDPSAGKAIGFMFIPIFDLYWLFIFWLRLADRVNFQFRLRGMAPPVSKGLAMTACIFGVIPYVNFLGQLFVFPFLAAQIQSATNRLGMEAAAAGQPAYSPIG